MQDIPYFKIGIILIWSRDQWQLLKTPETRKDCCRSGHEFIDVQAECESGYRRDAEVSICKSTQALTVFCAGIVFVSRRF